jgi:hypothetical protein
MPAEQQRILEALGFTVIAADGGINVGAASLAR